MKKVKFVLFAFMMLGLLNAKECVSPLSRSIKYHQNSAEIKALQLQAYQAAKMALFTNLKNLKKFKSSDDKKPAIILDLDETVLDTSDYAAYLAKNCLEYTEQTWDAYEKDHTSVLIPGALDFLQYASSKGVKIFYISNRAKKNKAYLLKTLKNLHLPQVSQESVLLKSNNTKQERRLLVAENYEIILQVGDTLHDFDAIFADEKDSQKQQQKVFLNAEKFGREWIILPNSLYGTWEGDQILRTWKHRK
ncbi:5'-nucleotidase, lipoprotein e(P4) family [Helicobacter mustelae]|nr:5'-nucleotidase, lipoprotein e(P4) family [Helicobacter mustelae]SQH71276.1 acid phosphatase [Helicobacter mustelae]